MKTALKTLAILLILVALGCEKQKAKLDKTIDKVKNEFNDSKLGEAAKKAEEAINEAALEVKKATNEVYDEAKKVTKKATKKVNKVVDETKKTIDEVSK